jgi:hypothetical protein
MMAFGQWRLVPTPEASAETTDDLGRFEFSRVQAGDAYLEAYANPFSGTADGPSGFAPTYLPGTDVVSAARPFRIRAGVDIEDVVVPLVPAMTTTLHGRVVDASGQPVVRPRVILARRQDGLVTQTSNIQGGIDGSFEVRDVPASEYVLQGYGSAAFGMVTMQIAGSGDRADVTLALEPLTMVRGRVVLDGEPAPASLRNLSVGVVRTDEISAQQSTASPVADDGTFAMVVGSGVGIVRATGPGGWAMKTVLLNGRDITDTPEDLRTTRAGGLTVVFTNRLGGVAGQVSATSEAPLVDVMILVAPEDSTKWRFPWRLSSVEHASPNGGFTIRNLLPGDYFAIAVPPFLGEPDPALLAVLRNVGTPFTVAEGQTTSIALTLYKKQ